MSGRRLARTGCLVFGFLFLTLPAMAELRMRPEWDGTRWLRRVDFDQDFERLVVKFRSGTGIRAEDGELFVDSQRGPDQGTPERQKFEAEAAEIARLLDEASLKIQPVFSAPSERLDEMRAEILDRRGVESVDLTLYVGASLPNLGRGFDVESLCHALLGYSIVEFAYPEVPTFFPAFWTPSRLAPPGITPNLVGLQDYLGPAPDGIDAFYAWGQLGATGFLGKLIDIDTGVNESHEDLPALFSSDGSGPDKAHGTAVLGAIAAKGWNGFGLKGIAHDAQVGFRKAPNLAEEPFADAILESAMLLGPGDVLLMETGKKLSGWSCPCNPTQAGTVAQEYYPAQFDAIQTAVLSGVTVVQVGGNGCVDYDNPEHDDWFNPAVQDSGAIIVGAGLSTSREPICYSPYGQRIDLHAWAENVVCLEFVRDTEIPVFDGGPNRVYGPNFGGTSSASAIVAGASLSLLGASRFAAPGGVPLDPDELRDLLKATGTPQSGQFNRPIGPMPDLQAAIDALP